MPAPISRARGLAQSCGAMVNYLYDLEAVEQNHEDYASRHTVISSRAVRSLAKATADWPSGDRQGTRARENPAPSDTSARNRQGEPPR
jgi:hypothetical protein